MWGVKHFAMVLVVRLLSLCTTIDPLILATSKDGKDGGVELIQLLPGSKPGDCVYFEGLEYESRFFFWYSLSLAHARRRHNRCPS